MYQVVMYMLNTNAEPKLVVAKRSSKSECRIVMRDLCGRGWTMERRPDVHTYGDLVVTFERVE